MSTNTAWNSLTGYLYYKPTSTLGRLRGWKKLWCALDNRECQLLGHRSPREAKNRDPVIKLPLDNAGISPATDTPNQFVLICDGKEHMLRAENHESMMIWLLGVQSKRDAHAKQSLRLDNTDVTSPRQHSLASNKESEANDDTSTSSPTYAKQSNLLKARSMTLSTPDLQGRRRMQERRLKSMRAMADSMDAGLENFSQPMLNGSLDHTKSLWEFGTPGLYGNPYFRNNDRDMYISSTGTESEDVFASRDSIVSTPPQGGMWPPGRQRVLSDTGAKFWAGRSISTDSLDENGVDMASHCAQMEQQLISTKCQLASLLNREMTYQDVLSRRNIVIEDLIKKLQDLETQKVVTSNTGNNRSKEQLRVMLNEKRFLGQEVKRLAEIQQNNHQKTLQLEDHVQMMDAEVEKWKRDYILLLQSCITIPTGDIMDGMQVNLYGGNIPKERINLLLEEARLCNPSLPSFASLCEAETHVDPYGFQHSYDNEGLLLHYICTQLYHHFKCKSAAYEEHVQLWHETICAAGHAPLPRTKEIKTLCRQGVPTQFRPQVWRKLINDQVRDIMADKGSHYFNHLIGQTPGSQVVRRYSKQIKLDLLRSMPSNIHFNSRHAHGSQQLRQVLQAFCLHNPTIGYCQGMNFIAAMALLIVEPQDTFWLLVALTEKYFITNYYDHMLSGAQADQEVLKELIQEKLPELSRHLQDLDVDISTITLNWFLALFLDTLPFQTVLRIWDCFLLEGPKVLFRVALAVLRLQEPGLLLKKDTISIMRHLKSGPKLLFDGETVLKVAFEDMKPLPHRQDIASKQSLYLKALKEKWKTRPLYRRLLNQQKQDIRTEAESAGNGLQYQCATLCNRGEVWVCYGKPNTGHINRVNIPEALAYPLPLQLDSSILCCCCVERELFMVGTLSGELQAFSVSSRRHLWSLRLHDTITALCCLVGKRENRLFVGLANGTIAVIDQVQPKQPSEEPIYIPMGRAVVSSLLIVRDKVWAAACNTIYVINAQTLDPVEKLVISNSVWEQVECQCLGNQGVWVAVKGSPVLQMWDIHTFTCSLLYDINQNQHVFSKKDDDPASGCSISALLAFHQNIWVGTTDGYLLQYETSNVSPMNSSPSSQNVSPNVPRRGKSATSLSVPDLGNATGASSIPRNNSNEELTTQHLRPQSAGEGSAAGSKTSTVETTTSTKDVQNSSRAGKEKVVADATDVRLKKSQMSLKLYVRRASSEEGSNSPNQQGSGDGDEPEGDPRFRHRRAKLHQLKMISTPAKTPTSDSRGTTSGSQDEGGKSAKPKEAIPNGVLSQGDSDSPRESRLSHMLRIVRGKRALSPEESKPKVEISTAAVSNSKEDLIPTLSISSPTKTKSSQRRMTRPRRLTMDDDSSDEEGQASAGRVRPRRGRSRSPASSVASGSSLTDLSCPPLLQLHLMVSLKVTERPVKCLIKAGKREGSPVVISCSGQSGDDEPVLRWSLHPSTGQWTNEPVLTAQSRK